MQLNNQKIGLGSVQWGLDYGISNKSGQTSEGEISSILSYARAYGINTIDTACLYGDSEIKLGKQKLDGFKIVTKTPSLKSIDGVNSISNFLYKAILHSLEKLNIQKLYGYMVHHADDLIGPSGPQVARVLYQLKERGLVEKIGFSIYSKEQLDAITPFFTPDLIQVPINVLDQRLKVSGTLTKMKDLGVEIHARSVFLQGLLLISPHELSSYFSPIFPVLNLWHRRVQEQKLSPAQAAIGFVNNIEEIDKIIVGVENTQQLEEVIRFDHNISTFNSDGLNLSGNALIDPRNWKFK